MALGLVYSAFERRSHRLAAELNSRAERQVGVLETRSKPSIAEHLQRLQPGEIWLSDTEFLLYGGLYGGMFVYVRSASV